MSMLFGIGRSRLKNSAVLALVLVGVLLYYYASSSGPKVDLPVDQFKLNQKRGAFKNAIYASWKPPRPASLDSKCDHYLKKLPSHLSHRKLPSFDEVKSTSFSSLLYLKKKWLAEEKKHYRRKLRSQGIRFEESHMLELERLYYQNLQKLSTFEEGFVEDMNHMRVFGKCLMESQCATLNSDASSKQIVASLFPWFLGKMPSIDRKEPEIPQDDIVTHIKKTLAGRGIVIPFLPHQEKSVQIRNSKGLISLLRSMGNTLPIEIIFAGKDYLGEEAERSILLAAEDEVPVSLDFRDAYLKANSLESSLLEMPVQKVTLVDVQPTVVELISLNDNFLLALSSIFTSFDEMIVISPKTIPLKKNLQGLFEDDLYKTHGTRFFKHKALLEFKPHKPLPGAFYAKGLIKNHAGVNEFDKTIFDFKAPDTRVTSRFRDKGYIKLLDPSLMVINKSKTLPGLLISSALPLYGALCAEYNFSGGFNPELMWLGQELSGYVEAVNFNLIFAVAAGLLTPPENLPADSGSQELCSSSWAQLEDDSYTLIYVTSHQLDNSVLADFVAALNEKYTVKRSNSGDIAHEKLGMNVLAIESVLVPVEYEEAKFNLEGQQSMSWRQLDKFGLAGDYWCAYDVVGDVNLQWRGVIINYGNLMATWYMFLLDTWVQGGGVGATI